jgi:D-hydroxyproline dehydrogenase subunit gamma
MPDKPEQRAHKGQLVRVVPRHSATLRLSIDGQAIEAVEGDSLLAVILLNGKVVRHLEFDDAPRAGFCFMGACQDCWVSLGNGERVRACTTLVADGMVIWTDAKKAPVDA